MPPLIPPSMDLLVLGGSVVAFRLLNGGLERLVPPPPSAQRNRWKWRNIWTSLAHSLLSGSWALLGMHSPMAVSPVNSWSGRDLFLSQRPFRDGAGFLTAVAPFLPLSQVILCFGFAFLVHRFVGFAMVALLVEINSIFLHLRTILLMAGLAHTTSYRLTSLLNLGTYVVFRITTLAWMTRWLVLNRENIPPNTYTLSTVGMAVMTPMNIVLFYRLLRNDFLTSRLPWPLFLSP
uniref:TLC domain containing 2 n=1 Tax=Podarcis muralis TaxID=64176 RepID=A0A670K8F2_PODMU